MPTWMASGPGTDWQIAMASRICSFREPATFGDQLAFHLSDKSNRAAKAD